MQVNESNLDRVLRVIIGVLLIGLALNGNIGAWGWIGVVPLIAGLFGFCPLYKVLGISTCPMRKS